MLECANELRRLIGLHCDGALSGDEATRLQELLRDGTDARRMFLEHADIHGRLCWEFGAGLSSEQAGVVPFDHPQDRRTPALTAEDACADASLPDRLAHLSVTARWSLAVTIAVFLMVTVGSWMLPRQPVRPPEFRSHGTPLATIVRAIGVRWRGSNDYQVGDRVSTGSLDLLSGLIVLETIGGAQVTIEAPARVELIDEVRAFLHSGRIVVRADTPDGFVVDTDRMKVVDKGTEFGVSVQPSGEEVVQVFSGKVLADFKEFDSTPDQQMELIAGQACSIRSSSGSPPRRLPFAAERFVRTFPEPNGDEPFKAAFQTKSQVETIDIVPAPADVVVDGDLSDWDRRGEFIGRCDPPFGDTYNVRGVMMYDERYLYIGAHVRDPAPMRSAIPPEADHSYCYRGGSLQVRFCADPSRSWPLPEYFPIRSEREKSQSMAAPGIQSMVHLSMWYCAAEAEPCLQISYGIPPLGVPSQRPEGWKGGYRRDADGLGYTLEYAIAWRLLREDGVPFLAGDETAACWQINWADREGRIRVAQLNECVNLDNIKHPDDLIDCWRQTASWGCGRFVAERTDTSGSAPKR